MATDQETPVSVVPESVGSDSLKARLLPSPATVDTVREYWPPMMIRRPTIELVNEGPLDRTTVRVPPKTWPVPFAPLSRWAQVAPPSVVL